jgi:hypothetical protein
MTMRASEKRSTVKCSVSLKERIRTNAAKRNMSMMNYIEYVVMKDCV